VNIRRLPQFLMAAVVSTWGVAVGTAAPSALADPCPDVEVVFARGTDEAPGVGGVGQAFVDAVRAQAGGKSVGVYAVNYPAGSNFSAGMDFARTVVDGIRDEADHVQSMAANCPNTRMILGGYSQGAVVTGFVTSSAVPEGVPAELATAPMAPEVADHVAAVVLFAKPSAEFLRTYNAPPVTIGSLYAGKTLELCDPGDTICSGAAGGTPTVAHVLYPVNGMVGDGAGYASARL
jgi:cutinase